MKSLFKNFHSLRYGLAVATIVAAGFAVDQRTVFAQGPQITIDFTVSSPTNPTGDINTATTASNTLSLTSGAATTETVNIWFVVTPGNSGATDDSLGILDADWAAASSVAYSNGASRATTNIGTGSSSGANTGIGPTLGSIVNPFKSVYSFGGNTSTGSFANGSSSAKGAFGDYAGVGINAVSGPTQATTADFASNGVFSDELGSTPTDATGGGGEQFGASTTSTGWAWKVGTMTYTLPTVTTGTATLSFAPTTVASFSGANVSWTVTGQGASTQLTNQTSAADALQNGLGVSFVIAAPLVGNTSVLTLAPTSQASPNTATALNFNTATTGYLVNATVPTQTMTLTNNGGSSNSPTTYTNGTTPTGFTVTDNNLTPGAITSGGTDTYTVGVNTATAGIFSGNYTVTNTGNGNATTSVALGVDVGTASAINKSGTDSFSGATVLSAAVANGGSYANLSSNSGIESGNSGEPGTEGSVATILMGTNGQGAGMTPSMAWRIRTPNETPFNDSVNGVQNGTAFINGTIPPVMKLPLISDVINLYGMSTASTGSNSTPAPTDPFAFQMSFNPATLKAEGATNLDMATRGNLYLASLVSGTWENTIYADQPYSGTFGATTTTTINGTTGVNVGVDTLLVQPNLTRPVTTTETFAQWAFANGVTAANIGNYIGVWGVDPDSQSAGEYNAWAIVDHNSEFAVVPEPSTILLAAFGVLGGMFVVRRRKNVVAA